MSFSSDIRKFSKKTEKAATLIFRGTALDLFAIIIRRTPILSGRLAGNWQTQINSAATGVTSATGKGAADSNAKAGTSKAKLGDSVFMVNNLPYAGVIENGNHSDKAPQGMVKVTVSEFQAHVTRNARKHK